MKKIFLILLILLIFLLNFVNAEIYINEVLFNPLGSDDNFEFVEIFGKNTFFNYTLGDLVSNDTLELLQYCESCDYSLIVEQGFDYSELNCSIYSIGATIGNGLANSADAVFLYYNDSLVDLIYFGGGQEGYSYAKNNLSWEYSEEIGGTPCASNFVINNFSINITLNDTINTSINNTINISSNNSFCNISIGIRLKENKTLFINNNVIKFYNTLSDNSYAYSVSYWIEDYFNNSLKAITSTSNLNLKQWTPKINSKYEIIKIKNKIDFLNCTNINNNTNSEQLLFIVNPTIESVSREDKSSVIFNDVKLSGNYVAVSGELYKGDTAKSVFAMKFRCKTKTNKFKNSPDFKIYLYDKFVSQNFYFRIPLGDILDECYSFPEIIYEGIGIEGEIDVKNFERKTELTQIPTDVDKINFNNESLQKLIGPKTFFASNFSDIVENYYFEEITESNFLEEKRNEANVKSSQKITGAIIDEPIYVDNNSFSFVNILIIMLLIILLFLIFFKKI